ncbi:MAG TPA: pyridoxamine 5'-phosphate oxidase family protein, partial [Tepidiformaceae bacterium]|nr:pyridoxamine 5'-phosphate oxidase family protein [Tepidiformaceae bacterium]
MATESENAAERGARREEVNVSELTDEYRALLSERRYAVLATQDPEGTIHQTPVWFMFEEGRFYIESNSASRKVKNLFNRPSASITLDARQPGMDRWVSASGATDILQGNEAEAINANIRKRYLTREAIEDTRIGPSFAAADDVTIRLTPTGWRWWSGRDVDERF